MRRFAVAAICMLALAFVVVSSACSPSTSDVSESGAESDAAPTVSAEDGEAAPIELASAEWSPEGDCATCHDDEESHKTEAHPAVACVQCHTDVSALGAVHEGKTSSDKMPTRLKKTQVEEDACESCHSGYEELAAQTSSLDILTDSEGTVVNPHEIKNHGGEEHREFTCADCHGEHKGKTPGEQAQSLCAGCHHANVYKCGTCHASL